MESDLVRSQYCLSIRFVPDGFSLLIYDENKQLILQKNEVIDSFYKSDIEKTLNNQHEIHNKYRQTTIFIESSVYTLIPSQFENTDTDRSMLELQFPALDKHALIEIQSFKNHGFSLLWVVPEKLRIAIQKIFPDIPYYHHLTELLKNQKDSNERVLIWLRSTEADFIISRKKKILLCNSFEIKTNEDLVYHTLNVLKQLELDIEQCVVKLYHDNSGIASLVLMKNFLPQINGIAKESAYENYQWEI